MLNTFLFLRFETLLAGHEITYGGLDQCEKSILPGWKTLQVSLKLISSKDRHTRFENTNTSENFTIAFISLTSSSIKKKYIFTIEMITRWSIINGIIVVIVGICQVMALRTLFNAKLPSTKMAARA